MKFKTYVMTKPERNLSGITRATRLTALLERDPRFSEIPNFAARLKALSPAPEKVDIALSRMVNVKGANFANKAALIAAALEGFKEGHFSDPTLRTNYRTLRSMQLQSPRDNTKWGGQKKVPPSGGDKRRYDPTGKSYAVRKSGVLASFATSPLASSWMQVFKNPGSVIPCVQRKSRREVMFATRRAGKGYKGKRRRTWATGIPC